MNKYVTYLIEEKSDNELLKVCKWKNPKHLENKIDENGQRLCLKSVSEKILFSYEIYSLSIKEMRDR